MQSTDHEVPASVSLDEKRKQKVLSGFFSELDKKKSNGLLDDFSISVIKRDARAEWARNEPAVEYEGRFIDYLNRKVEAYIIAVVGFEHARNQAKSAVYVATGRTTTEIQNTIFAEGARAHFKADMLRVLYPPQEEKENSVTHGYVVGDMVKFPTSDSTACSYSRQAKVVAVGQPLPRTRDELYALAVAVYSGISNLNPAIELIRSVYPRYKRNSLFLSDICMKLQYPTVLVSYSDEDNRKAMQIVLVSDIVKE